MTTPTVPDFGEPWRRDGGCIIDRNTDAGGMAVIHDRGMPDYHRDRIIACVNACAGIPTDLLQPGSVKRLVEVCQMSRSALACNPKFRENEPTIADIDASLAPFGHAGHPTPKEPAVAALIDAAKGALIDLEHFHEPHMTGTGKVIHDLRDALSPFQEPAQ